MHPPRQRQGRRRCLGRHTTHGFSSVGHAHGGDTPTFSARTKMPGE
ncbi:hypothetical protein C791_0844 [Amycolatopsis azurea DSM 43854]|uniref:Uncharacterized protein n=1 Tax=Amycolatopsis azurea DSM 43854 TaxID=1238180 RepID=M2Q4U1_9PSEU|nr:hypothetical protein C791_0844 [Amycolatopsis azurea DSM 43854]